MKLAEWLLNMGLVHWPPARVSDVDVDLPNDFHYLATIDQEPIRVYILLADALLLVDIALVRDGELIQKETVEVRRLPLSRLVRVDRTYEMVPDQHYLTGFRVTPSLTLHFEGFGAVEIRRSRDQVSANPQAFFEAIARLG